ncbi:acylglycerol kinase family protein [Brevibacterium sp. p3-SID960]|uniref:acylglycerol kinase family protein n=1 Tax=Brevibacterium sp. p3-SID960 TaxID=2916063 RepID=UPI0021A704B1|nr:acylglycerol kinase family protein [Brevibacterium sp. p3-SID960]MCT1691156.1 acylglycerol kinase family protein [Brevibacterium sp. p3-SID960]
MLLNPLAADRHPGCATALAAAAADLELFVPTGADAQLQFNAAAEAVEAGVDAVVVCGGDGTVAAGFALTAGTGIPLGIVPAGTGNDFARAAWIERGDPVGSLSPAARWAAGRCAAGRCAAQLHGRCAAHDGHDSGLRPVARMGSELR